MTAPLCKVRTCSAPAVWRVDLRCDCIEFRCNDCRSDTESLITHLFIKHGPTPECARCSHRMRLVDPDPVWHLLAAEDELAVTAALVADIETALREVTK